MVAGCLAMLYVTELNVLILGKSIHATDSVTKACGTIVWVLCC